MRDDHAVGLVHLLTWGPQALALVEYQVLRRLQAGQCTLAGLYPSQPRGITDLPTIERPLKAFKLVILTVIVLGRETQLHLTSVSKLQSTILKDRGCPADLYTRLVTQSQRLP